LCAGKFWGCAVWEKRNGFAFLKKGRGYWGLCSFVGRVGRLGRGFEARKFFYFGAVLGILWFLFTSRTRSCVEKLTVSFFVFGERDTKGEKIKVCHRDTEALRK
jgi:hypothetical protein